MVQSLYIDPRIRDNVFIPLVILMVIVSFLRYFVSRIMYSQDSPMLKPASMSIRVLRGSLFEDVADLNKEVQEEQQQLDLVKVVDEQVKDDTKDNNALMRSSRIRKNCEFLLEDSLKIRKSYYCRE